MGNTQSAQPVHSLRKARRSNRLSKAPTNNAANQLGFTWDQELFVESPPLSPYNPYGPYSSHTPWLDPQPVHSPELRPPINEILAAEPSSPASLRPSQGSGSQSAGEDGRARSNFGEIMGEFKRRMSRSGSRTRGVRFPHTPELDKLDARFSQHIPAGVSNAQTEEPGRAFGLGVSTRDGFAPTETHRFPSIRRLSLYNPGKTTRSPKNLLQTIFSPRNTEQVGPSFSYWGRDGHVPMRRTSADTFFLYEMTRSSPLRASTPSDLEYSHLGRLKLGSLRVVNGSASPAPSDRVPMSVRRQSFSDMKSVHLDHRNSTDLLRSRSRDWVDAYSSTNLQQTSYSHNSHLEPSPSRLRTPRIDRSQSPLRLEYGEPLETPPAEKHDSGLPVFRLSWPKNPEAFLGISSIPGSTNDQPLDLGASASPAPHESNQVLLSTSKANEFDDALFEDEGVEIVAGKNEPTEHKCNDELNRGRSMESSTRNSTGPVRGRKVYPLTKADSGYSSASSNRSLRRHKLALTKRSPGEDEATTGQSNVVSSRATKAIEECNETSTSRPTSRRRSLSETPPPVPRKDTPPILKTPNLAQYHLKHEELARVQSLTVRANASFSQRMGHIGSHDAPKPTPPATPILSPTPLDKGFRSFLTDNTPETEQSSWLWSPGPSQYSPLKSFEANYSSPISNQVNENTTPIHRSTSVQTKKSIDLAHFSHPHPLQAHRLHRPQSMVNLNKEDCTPDHHHRQQQQQQEQHQEESQGCVRGSFFRHRSHSKKRTTAHGDRTSFFGHRRTGSKPTNNPTQALARDAAPMIATESVRHNRNPPITKLDHDLPPTPIPEHERESAMLANTTSSRWVDSSRKNTSNSNNRSSNDNNNNDNNDREHNHAPSIFTGPFPTVHPPQNSRLFVRPKRSFVRGVEARRDPFFCVGFPQSQSQSQRQSEVE
ncbi:hypothetical protein GX50_02786 [[Emmonsia] crescens]|uniref:Uncharacterized protein n=1 Tax=[Emmonsia] crescens TaxID=73230 RepID=A0A2B7ZML8_9EURO|nr:hypothetical protein GX50_02786 [Emmonsia crescens]